MIDQTGQIALDDGPMAGVRFPSVRLPEFIRITRDPMGTIDCLDRLVDEPHEDEWIAVYRRRHWAHYRQGGYVAAYVHLPDADLGRCRRNNLWREYVEKVLSLEPAPDPGEVPTLVFVCRR